MSGSFSDSRSQVIGMLCVGTLAVGVLTGGAAQPEFSDTEGIVIVEAQIDVASADGEGKVVLFAWPANEVLADLEVGEQVNLDPVGVAEVATDGTFSVSVQDSDVLEHYASDFDEVNLFVSADNGESEFSESFAITLDQVEGTEADSDALVDLGELEASGDSTLETQVSSAESSYVEKSCSTTKVTNLGNKWIPIGGLFSTNAGATIDYQYSSGQSSSLGVAVSQTSSTTGFSASGTTSVSSRSTVDFPTMSSTGSKLARTQFRFGKYKTSCLVVHGGYTKRYDTWKVRADLWVGGTNFASVSAPSATYCASYLKGSTFTKDRDKQVVWSGAATFYGVGLTAQTGWSTKGKIVVKFPNAKGKVCGSNGYATEPTARQIVVK